MFNLGAPEVVIVLAILLLLFGSKKLPELSKNIVQFFKETKESAAEVGKLKDEVETQVLETKQSLGMSPQKENIKDQSNKVLPSKQ